MASKISVIGYAKLQAVMLGMVAGVLYSFGGFVMDALVSMGWVSSAETPGLSFGTVLAFGALIGMPLLFAVAGFVLGLVGAAVYNLLAGRLGVEFRLFEK